MTLNMKRYIVAGLSFLFLAALLVVAYHESKQHRVEEGLEPVVTALNKGCVDCHSTDTPALVMEWRRRGGRDRRLDARGRAHLCSGHTQGLRRLPRT